MINMMPTMLLLLRLLILSAVPSASSLRYHPEISIKRRQTHCMYHLLQEKTVATFEAFIIDSENEGDLSALIQVEGPVAPSDINAESSEIETDRNNGMGAQLQRKIEAWPSFLASHHHNFQLIGMIHHAFRLDFTDAGILEGFIDSRGSVEQEKQEQRNIQEEAQRREAGDEVYTESTRIETISPDSFEPYEWSKHIKTSGWYRMCIQAEESNIYVEADIRSSAADKLGGVDLETGHVYTHEKKEELEEAQKILAQNILGATEAKDAETRRLEVEKLRKEIESAVKDYDLEVTQKLMSEINTLIMQVQQKLSGLMKKSKGLEVHARRNRRRISRSGMIETVLYLVITGFQIYTLHSWLLKNSLLGR